MRDLVDPSGQLTKYGFEMVLSLKSKPLGRYVPFRMLVAFPLMLISATICAFHSVYLCAIRWNKLELREYNTVRLDTGEGDPLPLRHERPFWFSKVRSYSASPMALLENPELASTVSAS